ncbi:MAG: hypothetical protein KKH97_00635 [Proteobacteria bacterium]|nr:hypothetical protein [Pseudomonadota bacterium]MBU1712111.1 hypothetical protein [Pseudomonadota bacterium]
MNGVKDVKNGFRESREINTVVYDAAIITPDEMVTALKEAGTYIGTADD